MLTYFQRERRRRIAVWTGVILLTAGAVALTYWLVGAPPPKRIRLATGEPHGAYATFGSEYARILERNGLEVELVSTAGGIDNYRRLRDGAVDAAFVQGGTYARIQNPDRVLRGIAALYLEPLWVVYRGATEVVDVSEFRGQVVSVGTHDSGTEAIARVVLEVNGVTDENTKLVNLTATEAAAGLEDDTLDAAFLVSSLDSPVIKRLLADESLRLMDFRRHAAYARIFPYLTEVELAEGVLNLRRDIPSSPTTVLAPSALLACRQELHPRVVEQLLSAAREIHSGGSLIEKPGQFPTLDGLDLPVHETAEAYAQSGESLISRLVPYWALPWVVRAQFLIIPALTLWIPFFKILPLLYRLRVASLLKRHYAALRHVETGIERAGSSSELRDAIQALETLRDDMERLSRKIPSYYQRDVYHWRLHVSMVQDEARERIQQIGPETGQRE
ncbi:MAG: TAXI family TRAP transporter solute-binding subunit [Planctomycetota bacterium]|jgi:TRAP transporter TAXI family solute receptor